MINELRNGDILYSVLYTSAFFETTGDVQLRLETTFWFCL